MITSTDVRIAEYIIDTSSAVDLLIAGYRTNTRGRKPNNHGLRLLLIGTFLAIRERRQATVEAAYQTLVTDIEDDKERLGVYASTDVVVAGGDGRRELAISVDEFYSLVKTLRTKLAYTEESAPDETDATRAHRAAHVRAYCDGLIYVFEFAFMGTAVAIDATGIWSWGRGYKGAGKKLAKATGLPIGDPNADETAPEPPPSAVVATDATSTTANTTGAIPEESTPELDFDAEVETMSTKRPGKRRDVDAAWGVKTGKNKRDEVFFGYHEHTLVQIGNAANKFESIPLLIRRFELTNAVTDVVDVSLGLIDRLPTPIADIAGDRHYSYKKSKGWRAELARRGINQHLDLRENEHGFIESDRMRFVAGCAHCPATPDDLGTIIRPPNNASGADKETFKKRIALREAHALSIRSGLPEADGSHRATCPAVAGKVGCPLRPGTDATAVECGLPMIENPPDAERDGEPLPKCCTAWTLTVRPPEPAYKLQQPYYWGSDAWEKQWGQRSRVEGSYGIRKNPSCENMRRGLVQVFGLTWQHIVMGLVNASYNLRMLRLWCDDNPDHGFENHPLLATDDGVGYVNVSAEEHALIKQWRERANDGRDEAA